MEPRSARAPLILERFVAFQRELSIARGARPRRRDGLLPAGREPPQAASCDDRRARARLDAGAAGGSRELCSAHHWSALDYVGVLAIELFEPGDELLANEMAPRVHNSGHWTIEGAETSQFENHLRAILGLPLGSTAPAGSARW